MARRAKTGHVYWSTPEKLLITNKAVDTQLVSTYLSGLPLLRVAMKVLPPPRRRKIMSLTQVKWFEPSVQAEFLRRAEMNKDTGPIQTVVVGYADTAQNPFVPMFREMIVHLAAIEGALQLLIANQEIILASVRGLKA